MPQISLNILCFNLHGQFFLCQPEEMPDDNLTDNIMPCAILLRHGSEQNFKPKIEAKKKPRKITMSLT